MQINSRAAVFGFAFLIIFLNFACEPASLKKTDASASKSSSANSAASPTAEDNTESLEADLQTMRNADFDFVYVFRRKDGGALDGEDKKYLRANAPAATNRFILSDGNRAAIAGSSYRFGWENLAKLGEHFAIENFSKPEREIAKPNENKDAPKDSDAQKNSNR